jgi:hypothetical protein
MISLTVISASSTSNEDTAKENLGGHMMEKKEDLNERPADNEANTGDRNAEKAHVFAISEATILF